MSLPECEVIVKQAPSSGNAAKAAEFVSQLEDVMARVVRPCIVLDCAQVRRIDSIFLHLLLRSLEEAMKRNGDVRLSGVPDVGRRALESMGMERLFQFFPTATEAAESFRRPAAIPTILASGQNSPSQPEVRAA